MNAIVSFRIGSNNPMASLEPFEGRKCGGKKKMFAHVSADIVGRHEVQDRPDTAAAAITIKITNEWQYDSTEVCSINGKLGFLTPTNLLKLAQVLGEVANELKEIEEHTHQYDIK